MVFVTTEIKLDKGKWVVKAGLGNTKKACLPSGHAPCPGPNRLHAGTAGNRAIEGFPQGIVQSICSYRVLEG